MSYNAVPTVAPPGEVELTTNEFCVEHRSASVLTSRKTQ
jgi:hypothetical protein